MTGTAGTIGTTALSRWNDWNDWNGLQYYLIGAGPAGKQPSAHFRDGLGNWKPDPAGPPALKLS